MLFFFHLAGAMCDPDDEGVELATISDARIEAVKLASGMLRDRPEMAWLGDEFRVEVSDADQLLLFTFIAMGVDTPDGKALP
jgi:hypothetical protein